MSEKRTIGAVGCEHPAPAVLEAFLRGRLSAAAVGEVAAHLQVCRECAEDLAPTAAALASPNPPSAGGGEYEFPIFRACAAALRHAAALDAARRAVGRPAQREANGTGSPDRGLRRRDPHQMLRLARLAAELTAGLDPARCGGPAAHADLQARAVCEVGNAYRITNDLDRAEEAFGRALDLAGRGSGDPLVLAEIADRAASLFAGRRRFAEAFRLHDAVHAIYLGLGDPHLAARALVSKGVHAGYAGYPEQALELISAGLKQIDAARDPFLFASAIHNLLLFTVDCGRYLAARRLLADVRRLPGLYEEPIAALRLRFLEGRIAFGLGDLEAAERAFETARRGFLEHGLPYTAAVLSLDLLNIWLQQGRTAEIIGLVDEMLATFRALGIRREAVATLLVLRRAIEREHATAGLLRTIAARFERLERGPSR